MTRKPTKRQKRILVFTIEYSAEVSENMTLDIDEIIYKMQESGGAKIVNVEVRDAR